MPAWTATLRPNPSDPHPVTFSWANGRLYSTDDAMLSAVSRLATQSPSVAATPTGPFAPADLSIPYAAFQLVFDLALVAGLTPEDVVVEGDGWQWPSAAETPLPATDTAQTGVVY